MDARALSCSCSGRPAALRPIPGRTSPRGGLSTANETLERANLQFAAALIATLDARDRYTAGHSAAVAIYSRDIAERMVSGRNARACVSLRARSRHRQDRTPAWPA